MNCPLSYKYYTLLTFCFVSSCLLFILVASETITKKSEDTSTDVVLNGIKNSDEISEQQNQLEKGQSSENFETTTILYDEIASAIQKPEVFPDSDQITSNTIENIQVIASPNNTIESENILENLTANVSVELLSVTVPAADIEVVFNKTESSQIKLTEKTSSDEENPIPVFSEWAQQQMQEAEKKQEEHQNASSMKHNINATKAKIQTIKLRAKNYASPDCGAKILIANPEAQSTGSVLSAHKDEYLLSPCTSRIWFVVELCEPIQAERIELANFELFSSSPKDVSISISNRFPTRDFTNVGKFTAKDERNIQTFDLSPHLFGKFVRVDVLSHYNSEHFCPLSLFKVYGTSEFEAFETENQPTIGTHLDDFDEEHDVKKDDKKNDNLFNRAGEAVLNIVKKAAEVLVKREDAVNSRQLNQTLSTGKASNHCISLSHNVLCVQCTEKQHSDIVDLLSCNQETLLEFLYVKEVKSFLETSDVCKEVLGFNLKEDLCQMSNTDRYELHMNFFNQVLSIKYWRALCNLAATIDRRIPLNSRIFHNTNDQKTAKQEEMFNHVIQTNLEDNTNLKNISNMKHTDVIPEKNKEKLNTKETKETDETKNLHSIRKEQNNVEIPKTTTITESSTIDTADLLDKNKTVNIFNVVDENNKGDARREISSSQNLENTVVVESTIEAPPPNADTKEENPITLTNNGTWTEIETLTTDNNTSDNNTNQSFQNAQKNHPESVFLRLSNRIKALERNMSLSSQYLEELSKRYKKQVEELQQSFTKTILAIDEQNQRSQEQEQKLSEENRRLQENLTQITIRMDYFENAIIFIGGLVLFQSTVFMLLIRYWKRGISSSSNEPKQPDELPNNNNPQSKSKKQKRRRSLNDICEQLLKDNSIANLTQVSCDDLNVVPALNGVEVKPETVKRKNKNRTRKNSAPILMQQQPKKKSNGSGLVSLDENSIISSETKPKLNRSESVPKNAFSSTEKSLNGSQKSNVTTGPLLEENDEFIIPSASDFSYNEFVPTDNDQCEASSIVSNDSIKTNSSKNDFLAKTRRLSSPTFLKSALSRKSKKNKGEKSSWDWYKLNKSSSSSDSQERKKAKSESPAPRDRIDSIKLNGNGEINNKKTNGSFRSFLKKVF